jgi:crotonobetainyl-CoA:carnitine CoA-transferase CaiB-like acyl-CoA transferase
MTILFISISVTGDESRSFKPPEVNGESCYFLSFNRNKKSLAIDIKSKEGNLIILEVMCKANKHYHQLYHFNISVGEEM